MHPTPLHEVSHARCAVARVMPGVRPPVIALTMYRVIDTIAYTSGWIHRYPERAERGEGLMVILDPEMIKEPPDIRGHVVLIKKPDGHVANLSVTDVEVHHSVVGLFFAGMAQDEIPLDSYVEW